MLINNIIICVYAKCYLLINILNSFYFQAFADEVLFAVFAKKLGDLLKLVRYPYHAILAFTMSLARLSTSCSIEFPCVAELYLYAAMH